MTESVDTLYTRTRDETDNAYNSFGRRSSFVTILLQSGGPFLAEVVGASYAIMDTFWISKFLHEDGNAAMTFASLMDAICRAFGMFVCTAASSKLAYLRGENKYQDIPQVFADLFKFSILLGLLAPAILLPVIKPLLNFFNMEGTIRANCKEYLTYSISGTIVTTLNLFLCGCLQAEGRSLMYGVNQMTSFILNMAVFDPLMIGVLNLGMRGAAISTILSDGIPLIIFGILFVFKRLDTKCSITNVFTFKCSPHTWEAIKVGFTQFISHVCFSLPSFFSRKWLEIGASKQSNPTTVLAALNPVMRFWYIPGSYAVALSIGILPCLSYSLGRRDKKRVRSLFFTGLFMSITWCGVIEVLMFFFRRYYAKMFSKETEFLDITAKMLLITYICCTVMGVEMICASFIQSMKYALLATILSILTRFVPVPMFGAIFFYTNKARNIYVTLRMYPAAGVFSCFVGLLFVIYPFCRLSKIQDPQMSQPLLQEKEHNVGENRYTE
ncbi:MatE family protein [Trichomonas vaginalis G3]|uniref:MatE family protein n=1 Tax=Trichomonas vaginalis (strain ATCC PRA-98 / G3) TaxID=412133 RepID=A2DRU2_TRIV3|nr:multidrug resistance protein YPNP-related family [Trichomonas vaginalis G3]EAY16889.1 MatE family protein [Trichomonas vaginalis G3]KAI5489123.1 multidrug resistance protein YPNP-related family [Trichomonas vaginalis G3]|eukprot:XP_001329112.1 MatE family protein [Trichomonas vaginalis G3]